MNFKFRKRPVLIEAFQMTRDRRSDNSEWPDWLHEAWNKEDDEVASVFPTIPGTADGVLSVRTLEGEMSISWDDWIIRGVHGELYPCKPDIFDLTYDPESESPQ